MQIRARPVTARGKDSLETILAAAAGLLTRLPAHQVTTHTIADAAGVNIATLYRYFDDVTAILREPMDGAPIDPGGTYKRDVDKLKSDLDEDELAAYRDAGLIK